MTPRDPARGSALPAALLVVAVAAVAAASLATLAQTEVLLARNRLSALRALSAADGCVADGRLGTPHRLGVRRAPARTGRRQRDRR